MAKLIRPTETKIFGSTALAAELTPFGSSAPSTDINLILNSLEAQRGWGTIGANGFPPMEWFNALGYGLSYYNAYLMQQGIPEWTALQNYYINSYVVGANGKLYISLSGVDGTPNIGNNPTTDAINWKWIFDSVALTGNPTAPTQAQFDNDTSLATTEFVQRALGSKRGMLGVGVSTTMTASAHAGQIVFPTTGSLTFTLPLASTCPVGTIVSFEGNGFGCVINRQGTDTIGNGLSGSLTTYTLKATDSIYLMSDGGNVWYVISGEARLEGSTAFANLKAGNGYQKLPSGLIIQWGSVSYVTSGVAQNVTLPIVFPNAGLVAFAIHVAAGTQAYAEATAGTAQIVVRANLSGATLYFFTLGY